LSIQYLKYNQIDFKKYDFCIENAYNSRIYAFSWYLDIVAEKKWEILVLNDYEAVMPLPIRKKYLIKYVYNPLWILQLGVFSVNKNIDEDSFLKKVFETYKLIDIRLNITNKIELFKHEKKVKQTHFLELTDYDTIKSNFRSDRKKDLKRAVKAGLNEKWNASLDEFLALYSKNLKARSNAFDNNDYDRINLLLQTCIEKDKGDLLSIYDENNQLVAAGFFLKHHKRITILVSTTDLNNRKNGANTFLINQAIQKYLTHYEIFDFGGSSITSIANYFLSFGALEDTYFQIQYNNLPLLYKIFKSS
jgi:hypothetical protein